MGLVGGLVALGGLAYGCAMHLERSVVEDVLAERGRDAECHIDSIIRQAAEEEFAQPEPSFPCLARRLVKLLRDHPDMLDLVVVDTDRTVVASMRGPGRTRPCSLSVPLDNPVNHEHAAGSLAADAVACKSVPIRAGEDVRGVAVYHARRVWTADGTMVQSVVGRLALRFGSVFGAFYLLLGALLVWTTRARDRWRMRAASAERVEALGVLADGINHEIKNPLNAVGLSLQLLARKHAGDEETREVVASAAREAERIGTTLERFARYARAARPASEEIDIGDWLRERFAGRTALAISGHVRARIDVGQMESAFSAIVDCLGQHGECRLVLSGCARRWRVAAEVNAPDLDPSALGRLFDPYVRPCSHDVCSGLGLARAVFQAHGGTLEARLKGGRLLLTGSAPTVPPETRK